MGTCIETLDSDGIPLHQWDTDSGNVAICHWMYYVGQSNATSITKNGTAGINWGETRYLNRQEWGYGGSNLTGVAINGLGVALTLADQGFVTAPALGATLYTAT